MISLLAAANIAVCLACHGQASSPTVPHLNGQKQVYLEDQLRAFRSGSRKGTIMNGMALGLTDADIKEIAKYFSEKECR